jgi:hypothetical protein
MDDAVLPIDDRRNRREPVAIADLCEAAGRRDTIRWAFYVVTPPGIQKLERQAGIIASGSGEAGA